MDRKRAAGITPTQVSASNDFQAPIKKRMAFARASL